jgi:hypothetical protein
MSPQKSLAADQLHQQFFLGRERDLIPQGWPVRQIGNWALGFDPSLSLLPIKSADGTEVGLCLGHPIDAEGLRGEPIQVSASSAEAMTPSHAQELTATFGGRYVLALLHGAIQRIYPDPLASLGVVYNPTRRCIASTPTLLGVEARVGAYPDDKPGQFFPAGLTAEPGISRLLPNHFLDLEDWKSKRYWPDDELPTTDNPESEIQQIANDLKHQVESVAASMPLTLQLTSGIDSRMILAGCREVASELICVTHHQPHAGRDNVIDVKRTRQLTKRFGLNHRILEAPPPTDEDRLAYLRRIGQAGHSGKAGDFFNAYRDYHNAGALMNGLGGEIVRRYYWRPDDKANQPLAATELASRMKVPSEPRFLKAIQRWLDETPGDTLQQLDLLYLENRVGCWASPHMYGTPPFDAIVLPLSSPRIVRSMLRLPVNYRRRGRLGYDVINRLWPELLNIPVNKDFGLRRGIVFTKKALFKTKLTIARTLNKRGLSNPQPNRIGKDPRH